MLSHLKKSSFILTLTFLFWSVVFIVIWSRILILQPNGLYAGWVGVWGDWAAHISFASYFSVQNSFPPQFPILAGHVLSYPFASDLISGILMRVGIDLVSAMILPSIIFSILLVFGLIKFYKLLLKTPMAISLAVFLFLLNGGLGFLWFLQDTQSLGWGILFNFPREYTHLSKEANIEWINIITSEFIPQRGFLLGLPLALFVLGTFWKVFENPKNISKKLLFTAGVITGLMPLVHMHSLIILSGFFIWTLFLSFFKYGERAKILLWYFIPAFLIAVPLIHIFYPGVGGNFIKFQPGWLAQYNVVSFWVNNAGIMLLLPIAGMYFAKRNLILWLIPSWAIFLLANLFLFQPFAWDNTKFFTYWWLGISAFAAILIEKLLSSRFPLKIIGLSLFVVAIVSGALDILGITQYSQHNFQMLSWESMQVGAWAKNNTPTESIFLTADNHDHPVTMLSGRRVVRGFPGWLWTYGLDTTVQGAKVEVIYNGEPTALEYLKDLKVNYIVVGPWEKNIYKSLNSEFFQKNFPVVFENDETQIFKVTSF